MTVAVLIVEDEEILAKNIRTYLGRHGFEASVANDANQALDALGTFRPDVVLVDYNLPGMNGLELIAAIREQDKRLPIVMLTGHGSIDIAVNAMKAGAADYLSKPVALSELKLVLERVGQRERTQEVLDHYQRRESRGIDVIIGDSAPMQSLKSTIRQILDAEKHLVDGDPPAVLITGETGTGKELIARALHYEGARRDRAFVELNCASIPSNLLEAELFGYERGAFTDARNRKPGLVESADGGTLFLDEIGEVELTVQAKLLKLLEEKTVRRLGGIRETKVNLRIVAATNRDLEAMVKEGKFRSDLFFRLRILQIRAPALRERGTDILALARTFIDMQSRRYGKAILGLTPAAEAALMDYDWPGNVRELRNTIEQAVLLARDTTLDVSQFQFVATPRVDDPEPVSSTSGPLPTAGLSMPDMERQMLTQALVRTGWNVTRAAKLLGLSRDTVRYRIEKYGLKPDV